MLQFLLAIGFLAQAATMSPPGMVLLRWLLVAIACVMIAVSVLMEVIQGSTSLEISSQGMKIRYSRLTETSLEWSDIDEFFPERLLGRNYVAFNVSPQYREKLRRKRFSGIHKGRLPDTYGFSAEALAELLNERKASAVK